MGVETGLLGRSLTYESMETLESAATYGAGWGVHSRGDFAVAMRRRCRSRSQAAWRLRSSMVGFATGSRWRR